MKRSLAAVVASAFLLAAGSSVAQSATPAPAKAEVAAARPAPAMDMTLQMDGHMKAMQALHDRMKGAGTPEERQKLGQEQQAEMQSCMAMMNHAADGGGMIGSMGGGAMAQPGKPADGDAQMQMMQKRMDMMQLMMQTMVDQHELTAGSHGAVASPKP